MGQPEHERQRTVRFHGRVQFKTIRHVADFSESEIAAAWYCKRDFMRMSDEVAEIAKLLAGGQEYYNGEELSIRGLEHLVEEDVAEYRAEKMVASIDAVLDEQDEQAEADVYDPAMIAKIYSEIVTPLLREAYLVGLRDAKEGAAAAELIPDLSLSEIRVEGYGEKQTQQTEEPLEDADEEKQAHRQREPQEDAGILAMEVEEFKQSDRVGSCDHNNDTPAPVDDHGDNHILEERITQLGTVDGTMDTLESVETSETDAPDEGEEQLNTSLNSMTMEAHPEKTTSTSKISGEPGPKEQNLKQERSTASSDDHRKAPGRKPSKRKNFDRKSGTEMSPFVFRRDGTIGFRNYDVEHRSREQSKQRKDCVKSALFSFLDDGAEDDEEFAKFIAQNEKEKKEKKSKLYAASFPSKSKAKSKSLPIRTTAAEATSTTMSTSSLGKSSSSHPKLSPNKDKGTNHSTGVQGSMGVQKKIASPKGGWSKVVPKDEP